MRIVAGVSPDGKDRMAVMPEVGDRLVITPGMAEYEVKEIKCRNLNSTAGFEFSVSDYSAWSPNLNPFGKGNSAMYTVIETKR